MIVSLGLSLPACGGGDWLPGGTARDEVAPVTLVVPPGGTYAATVRVTLAANEQATLRWTLDGTDPEISETAHEGPSPLLVDITASASLRFSAVDPAGNHEAARTEGYVIDPNAPPSGGGTGSGSGGGDSGGGDSGGGGSRTPPDGGAGDVVAADEGGIQGTVVLAPDLAGATVVVSAYDFPPSLGGNELARTVLAAATPSTARPYTLAPLPRGNYHLYAIADEDGDGDSARDRRGVPVANPIAVDPADPATWHRTGVDIYVGVQDPGLGSVSGVVTLSAPVPQGRAWVLALDNAQAIADAFAVGLTPVALGATATSFAYAVRNLPAGHYDVAVVVRSADGHETWGRHDGSPSRSVGLGERDSYGGVDFEVGTGWLRGTITVTDPHGRAGKVWVEVSRIYGEWVTLGGAFELGSAGEDGTRHATCALFGLPDGYFGTHAILDTDNDGDFNDESIWAYGDDVSITHGSTGQSDFELSQP
jgi:uncharacterized protein (DUF2141 family)